MKHMESEDRQNAKLNGWKLLIAMNALEDEWIETEQEKKETNVTGKHTSKKTIGWRAVKWAAAAVSAVLLLGGGVAYAAVHLGIFQFTVSDNEKKPGYRLSIETERVSKEELTGGINEVKAFLQEQMSEEGYQQEYPSWLKSYDTLDEARAYIGYAGLKETITFGEPERIYLRVIGDTKGNPGRISLFTTYYVGEISLEETSDLFTTECPFPYHCAGIEHVEELIWKETYRKEDYTTKSGKNAVVVFEEYKDDILKEGTRCFEGFLADGAVFYSLRITCCTSDLETAKALLYQWFEQF